jgi:hypothetical protein
MATPASAASRSTASVKVSPSVLVRKSKVSVVLARGEAVIEALLLVDGEGGHLLRLEGRQADIFAALAPELYAAAEDGAHPQSCADFVQDGRGGGAFIALPHCGIARERPEGYTGLIFG